LSRKKHLPKLSKLAKNISFDNSLPAAIPEALQTIPHFSWAKIKSPYNVKMIKIQQLIKHWPEFYRTTILATRASKIFLLLHEKQDKDVKKSLHLHY